MSQTNRLHNLLRDGKPHRTDEILRKVYGDKQGIARIAARIYDIKQKHGVEIDCTQDKNQKTLYWYTMSLNTVFK